MHGDRNEKKLGNPAGISGSCVVSNFRKHFMNSNYTTCNCKNMLELKIEQTEVMKITCWRFGVKPQT
jgi:hypothetical protein